MWPRPNAYTREFRKLTCVGIGPRPRTGLVHTAGYGSLRDGAPTPLPQRQALHPSRIGADIHINEPVAMRLSDAEDAIRAVLRTSGQRRSTSNDAQAEK